MLRAARDRVTPRVRARVRRAAIAIASLCVAPWLVILVWSMTLDLPAELRSPAGGTSLSLRDRHGVVLREVLAEGGDRRRPIRGEEVSPHVRAALVAAEDLRFYAHPGVDPIAVVRAVGQAIWERRIVSGGSTITQQLARTLVPRPRTILGKMGEMALALRIERSLSKAEILEAYLNHVVFGPGLTGVEAASRFTFDKPASELSLGEAAALAGMPRGPSLYDPRKGTDRLLRRRNRVLERMRANGLATEDEARRAIAEPLAPKPRGGALGIAHLTRAIRQGKLGSVPAAWADVRSITLTIDRDLQRTAEVAALETVRALADQNVGAAAVIVIENETGEILAYVGSHDFTDVAGEGQNDGVLMRRQPGSTLKPFVYGLAMEALGQSSATLFADVPTELPVPGGGTFAPQNYDGRFHGPVRMREALARSYNIPAVMTADRLGAGRVLERLKDLGFSTLDGPADRYGVAIALGDGEVRLLDLANAYATIARGGRYVPPSAIRGIEARPGAAGLGGADRAPIGAAPARRVMAFETTVVLADILSDDRARRAAFGADSALAFPFPAAAKTGTSKQFRDNWAVGLTREVTVAAWVGRFDGASLEGVSGVTGAAPLMHEVLIAAQALYPEASRAPLPVQIADGDAHFEAPVEICPLSGARRGPSCPHGVIERFPVHGVGRAPEETCAMHVSAVVERGSGRLARSECPDTETRVFERYPPSLSAWASAAGRPLLPTERSVRCPPETSELAPDSGTRAAPKVLFPSDGASLVWDPHVAAAQSIVLRAATPGGSRAVFVLDGLRLSADSNGAREWRLSPGEHRLFVDAGPWGQSETVAFSVDGE